MSETESNWRERATELHIDGGVPERRAQIVALRERGLTYEEIAEELGLSSRSSVRTQVEDYKSNRTEAEWVVEHGPTAEDL